MTHLRKQCYAPELSKKVSLKNRGKIKPIALFGVFALSIEFTLTPQESKYITSTSLLQVKNCRLKPANNLTYENLKTSIRQKCHLFLAFWSINTPTQGSRYIIFLFCQVPRLEKNQSSFDGELCVCS